MKWKVIDAEKTTEAAYDAHANVIYFRDVGSSLSFPMTVSEFEAMADDGITIDDLPTFT